MIAIATILFAAQAHPGGARCADFRPDGKVLATAGDDGAIKVWLTSDWKLRRQAKAHGGHVTGIDFSGDGRILVSGGYDGKVKVWSGSDGTLLNAWSGGTSYVSGVAASRDGKRVYSCGYDNRAKMWDAKTGKLLRTYSGLPSDAYGMAVSPDGKYVCAVGPNDGAVVWQAANGKKVWSWSLQGDYCTAQFSPDGGLLAFGALGGQLNVVEVPSGRIAYQAHPETGIIDLTWLDDRRLLVASYTMSASIYDVPTAERVASGTVAKDILYGTTATADGRTGVFCSSDGEVIIRDLSDWRETASLGR